MQSQIDGKVQALWDNVVATCNRVLIDADVYGFELMGLADPNVHQIAK